MGEDEPGDGVEETADGVDGCPVRRGHRLRQGVEGPEVHRGGVEKEEWLAVRGHTAHASAIDPAAAGGHAAPDPSLSSVGWHGAGRDDAAIVSTWPVGG